MTKSTGQQKYKVCDKKSTAQYEKSYCDSIIKFSCCKCKKNFKFTI